MIGLVARRAVAGLVVLGLASVVVHVLVTAMGDPLAELGRRNPPVPASVIEGRRHELGLDRPALPRYFDWLGGAVQGDLGVDLQGRPVAGVVGRHLVVTLRLVAAAVAIALVLAVVLGTASALRRRSAGDLLVGAVSFLLLSTPVFWLAVLLKEHVALRVNHAFGSRILYTVGAQSPDLTGGWWSRSGDILGHLALPATALALVLFASWNRFHRVAVLDQLGHDHVRLARATGAGPSRVLVHHVLRNALVPLTTVVAVDFAVVLGGAILVEEVFAWPGMGSLLVEGVTSRDTNLVLGWLLASGAVVVVCNLAADMAHALLDPRIRHG